MLHLKDDWRHTLAKTGIVLGLGLAGLLLAAAQSPQTVQPTGAMPTPATPSTQSTLPANSGADKPDKTAPPKNFSARLGNGDLLEMSVYNVPELSAKVRIDGNGDVYLPLIDYVHLAGLTVNQAQGVIEKRLDDGGFVKSPHVSIFVDEATSQGVTVLGEVVKPGVYPVPGKEQLLDLISAAGGLTERAGHVVTVTHREEQDKPVTVELAKNFANTPETNIEIQAGDTVVIHKADVIYVVGDVARPSGLLIDRENLTVLQAVALAGGTTPTSRPNGARILHKGPNGITETHVPLKKILQARAADIPMKPDDILFVPSSLFKTAFMDNASIAMQATSLGLVAVR
jgi:polysaccharide export outer membrane protein